MEHIKRDRHADWWLLLPWFTLGAVWIAGASGAADWILDNLPHGLGAIVVSNIGWGMLVLTLGSSARWGYLQFWNRSRSVGELLRRVILVRSQLPSLRSAWQPPFSAYRYAGVAEIFVVSTTLA